MRLPVTLVLAVLLSACGSGGEPADPSATADAMAGEPMVLLERGQILVSGHDWLSFDEADQDSVTAAFEDALGTPSGESSVAECPSGPMDVVSWGGLDLHFADGTLVGWYLEPTQPAGVIAPRGVEPGTTRADLDAAFPEVTVEESTIGIEWLADGVSGTLSNDGEDGTVEVVWAGLTCIAR